MEFSYVERAFIVSIQPFTDPLGQIAILQRQLSCCRIMNLLRVMLLYPNSKLSKLFITFKMYS